MKSCLFVFFIATNILFNLYHKLQPNISDSQKNSHKEIYLYLGKIGYKTQILADRYNLKSIYLIGGDAIDPENNGTVNTASLQKDIKRVIPDSNAIGIAILDWEGKAINQLSTFLVSDTEDFKRILNEGKEMVQIAKTLRPKIEWGIYGLPFRNYWTRNAEWRTRCFMLLPLLKECDLITPSVYSLYPDSIFRNGNRTYIEDNVRLALHIGQIINKPVLPFITHRWPNSKLIPRKEFINYVDTIFKTEYLDNEVTGIIWWGPDAYYYSTNDKEVRSEVKGIETFSTYFDSLVSTYLSNIVQLSSFYNKVP
jgi:hypothetical protein